MKVVWDPETKPVGKSYWLRCTIAIDESDSPKYSSLSSSSSQYPWGALIYRCCSARFLPATIFGWTSRRQVHQVHTEDPSRATPIYIGRWTYLRTNRNRPSRRGNIGQRYFPSEMRLVSPSLLLSIPTNQSCTDRYLVRFYLSLRLNCCLLRWGFRSAEERWGIQPASCDPTRCKSRTNRWIMWSLRSDYKYSFLVRIHLDLFRSQNLQGLLNLGCIELTTLEWGLCGMTPCCLCPHQPHKLDTSQERYYLASISCFHPEWRTSLAWYLGKSIVAHTIEERIHFRLLQECEHCKHRSAQYWWFQLRHKSSMVL
eukprot:04018_2